jgi:hypothetical protein
MKWFVAASHLAPWIRAVQVNYPDIQSTLTAVVQSRICRVDVRYPDHISGEAKSFISKVCTPAEVL